MAIGQDPLVHPFLIAEYQEAANAYFKGVDLGYNTVKSYITINGLFAALVGALSDPKGPLPAAITDIVRVLPWLALITSFAIAIALPHYFRHLNNCSRRCAELEKYFEGQLFRRLTAISDAKSSFNTGIGLLLVIGTVAAFWIHFALKLNFPDLSISQFIKSTLLP